LPVLQPFEWLKCKRLGKDLKKQGRQKFSEIFEEKMEDLKKFLVND